MSVEFESDQFQNQYRSRTVLGQPQVPSMASWMMKKGIIKDESKAGNILIGIVILNFAITAFLIYYFIF
jgi:hypothetical protein